MPKRKGPKKSLVPAEAMESIKKQILEFYGAHAWDDLLNDGYLSDGDEETLAKDMWESPINGEKFECGNLIVVPFCSLVDGGEPVATFNLKLLRQMEYQQAEVKVYEKEDPSKNAYLFYSGDDNSEPPAIFSFEAKK